MAWFDFSVVTIDVTPGAVRAHRDTSITAVNAETLAAVNLRQAGNPVAFLTSEADGTLEFEAEDPVDPTVSPTIQLTMLGQTLVVESTQQKIAKSQFTGSLDDAADGAIDRAETAGRLLSPTTAAATYLPVTQKAAASGLASLDSGTKVPIAQVPNLPASQTTSGTFATARIPDLRSRDGLLFGTDGRKYRLIAGTIRNTGAGWFVIDDASHRNTGIVGISETSSGVVLDTEDGTRVVSLTATPDETYAARGIVCGVTVGLTTSTILLYEGGDGFGDYVSYDGTNWVSSGGVFTINSYASGILTLGHPSITGLRASATRRGLTWIPSVGQVTATTTQVVFYTTASPNVIAGAAASTMQVYVNRFGRYARAPIDPSTLTEANGNIWISGVLEVA